MHFVTPAVALADGYRGVLLGVARTVTFDDPAVPEPDPVDDVHSPHGRSPFG